MYFDIKKYEVGLDYLNSISYEKFHEMIKSNLSGLAKFFKSDRGIYREKVTNKIALIESEVAGKKFDLGNISASIEILEMCIKEKQLSAYRLARTKSEASLGRKPPVIPKLSSNALRRTKSTGNMRISGF